MAAFLYIRVRKYLPDSVVDRLRANPILKSIAARFQPQDLAVQTLMAPLDGFQMSIPSNWVYSMVWGSYEPACCEAIVSIVKPGMRVLDVGAHIGYLSLLLARIVGADGQVICFEPLPNNRDLLAQNVALNKMQDRVRIEPMAVADKVDLALLFLAETSSEASLQAPMTEHRIPVATCSLDAYFALLGWPPVDFIKMDIEGSETLAIRGMHDLLRRSQPALLIEAHGEPAREGLEYLTSLGYSLLRLGEPERTQGADLTVPLGHAHWLAMPPTGTLP